MFEDKFNGISLTSYFFVYIFTPKEKSDPDDNHLSNLTQEPTTSTLELYLTAQVAPQ
jgi:hypothetical protein